MKCFFKIICIIGLVLGFSAKAQEDLSAPTDEPVNAFGFPTEGYVKTLNAKTKSAEPTKTSYISCNDKEIRNQIHETIKDYVVYKGNTIIDNRKRALILKNVDNFTEIAAETLSAATDSAAKARLVELKINDHLDESKIQICKASNIFLKSAIYLFIYPKEDKTLVEIVNFNKNALLYFFLPQDK